MSPKLLICRNVRGTYVVNASDIVQLWTEYGEVEKARAIFVKVRLRPDTATTHTAACVVRRSMAEWREFDQQVRDGVAEIAIMLANPGYACVVIDTRSGFEWSGFKVVETIT